MQIRSHNVNSLPRAETDCIPTFHEGQLATDRYHEESASSLDEKCRAQSKPLRGKIKTYKKIIGTIFGLYLIGTLNIQPIEFTFANPAIALLCSISHYIFFDRLHGSIASGEHASMTQSYATAVSLRLVTLFKASLLGCVGICSAQYVWLLLRGQPIAVSTVESLFQMRHNPHKLFYCRTLI
jgi:hypothetical protein